MILFRTARSGMARDGAGAGFLASVRGNHVFSIDLFSMASGV